MDVMFPVFFSGILDRTMNTFCPSQLKVADSLYYNKQLEIQKPWHNYCKMYSSVTFVSLYLN